MASSEPMDEASDEVLYDSCCEGDEGDDDAEVYDDCRWVDGPPPKAIAAAMELVTQCWNAETLCAELLTESEVKGELAQGARRLSRKSTKDMVAGLTRTLSDQARARNEIMAGPDAEWMLDFRGLAAAAVGCKTTSPAQWREQARRIASEGGLRVFLAAFGVIYNIASCVVRQDPNAAPAPDAEKTAAVVGPALRALLNGLAGILLGCEVGLPHSTEAKVPPSAELKKAVVADLKAYCGFASPATASPVLMQIFDLIREAPTAPGMVPGKKLILTAHIVIAAIMGPVDVKPAVWREGFQRSNRWVGDGAVEQYIGSVMQSGASNSRMQFLTPDLLRTCHYYYLHKALKVLMNPGEGGEQPTSGAQLAAKECAPQFKGIPFPVREGLATFGWHLAASMHKRGDSDILLRSDIVGLDGDCCAVPKTTPAAAGLTRVKTAHRDVYQPCSVTEPFQPDADRGGGGGGNDDDPPPIPLDAIPEVTVKDPRTTQSLAPEFPPQYEAHLQVLPPEERYVVGTPSPGSWHATHHPQYVRREDVPPATPEETLYRMLYPVLPGVVIGGFKLFLASLPGEDSGSRMSAVHELEAASYGVPATAAQELQRQRNVMIKAVTGFLLHLVKVLARESRVQSQIVLQTMCDSNGLLLLLKYLHQNSVSLLTGVLGVPEAGWEEAIEIPCPLPPHDGDHVPWYRNGDADVLPTKCRCVVVLDGDTQNVVQCDARNLLTCATVLHLLRKLVRKHPSRLALMLFYKMHILVRRKLRIIHPLMTLYGLKLINDLNPHMGRKWRVQNVRALSQLYRYLRPVISDTCVAAYANIEPYDASTELPVPEEQRETERHILTVTQEYGAVDYPQLRPYSLKA